MSAPDERIARLTATVEAWAAGQIDMPLVPAADGGALVGLEQGLASLQTVVRRCNGESTSLANANVRLMLWNEALQKINHADSILYHGGDIEIFYQRVIADAMEMTRARYGALAVFDGNGGLAEFVARGMDEAAVKAIGHQPEGKGLLAAAFHEQSPLRVVDIGADPRSCGFPPGHPPMQSLMAVPMRIGGKLKGVIYLADKEMGELFEQRGERFSDSFTDDDEIMLGLFSDYLVRALERIELMTMLKESNRQLEKRGVEQETLIRETARRQEPVAAVREDGFDRPAGGRRRARDQQPDRLRQLELRLAGALPRTTVPPRSTPTSAEPGWPASRGARRGAR